MGLYDTVIVEGYKLKIPQEIESYLKAVGKELPNDFQTKDLSSSMGTYYIDKNGQMYFEYYEETGKRIKRDDFWKTWTDNRSFIERMFFKFKNKAIYNRPVSRTVPEYRKAKKKFTETHTFNFYTYEEIAERYIDIEYKAEVVNGKVKNIELVKYNLESISAAKKRKAEKEVFDKKMQESFEARKRFTSTWYYPILRETYNPFIFFLKLLIQKVCQKIISWTYRWTGV